MESMRPILIAGAFCATLVATSHVNVADAQAPPPQGMGLPAGSTPPSLQQNPAASQPAARPQPNGQVTGGGELPRNAGQEHRVYDLTAYTRYLTQHDRPEQAVIDWILRETGTDVWFTEPFGFMSATRDQLSVYHTPEVHQVVAGIVDRFIAGDIQPQVLHLRLMTVGNPNWRARAHMLMTHVPVDSPGVQAWLLSKENAAVVLNMLRQRTDAREVQGVDLPIFNGQTEKLSRTRGRNYVRNVRESPQGWPPYEPETGEVQEGYRLSLSPLLTTNNSVIDVMIKAEIDQVDKFNHVDLELPLRNQQVHRTRIDVPQVVSWRLHERFRWESDKVLLLSCGVVASPERPGGSSFMNLDMLTGNTSGRADALMFVEFRGRASENLTTNPIAPRTATAVPFDAPHRGRY
ncbi:putative secreted protein [Rhodopirellula maiorica SM1]|uniref:Putative secreted protein n=2 Tax=Novipirellula TaxID=2795426 RepID=M5RKB2_9BACT|nr:putative secreted protein [Rhodopirellula maiorica SM1]